MAQVPLPGAPAPVVVVHQPDFAPYLGFFHRLYQADLFVVLDHVQFAKGGWHHRDRILTANGPVWLTLPVRTKGRFCQAISEVELVEDGGRWRTAHLRTLRQTYGKAPGFPTVFPMIEDVYAAGHRRMVDHNLALIRGFMDLFGITTDIVLSSDHDPEGSSNEMLISLVRAVGGRTYLSGTGARAYMDEALWADSGLHLVWQDFVHPEYPQLHGEAFEPYLSSIDFAMNCGGALRQALRFEAAA